MKNRKVTKILAAVLTGAMLMATPSVAMADLAVSSNSYTQYVVNPAVPVVQNLAVSYNDRGEAYLLWTPVQLTDDQEMYIEYSSSAAFPDTDETRFIRIDKAMALRGYYGSSTDIYGVPQRRYGLSNYYRAVIVDDSTSQWVNDKYTIGISNYSNVATYVGELGEIEVEDKVASKKSVYFKFNLDEYDFDGVEIYRAEGSKKYEKVAVTTDAEYTDKNLKSETTYRYKLRGYQIDQTTQEKNYGDYVYHTMTTWGSDLNVEAKAKDAKTVKLTWDKVKGATEYQIYRAVGTDIDYTVKDGSISGSGSTKYKLLDTVKAKKTSYKDKKLKSGVTYNYLVRAVKETKKGNKVIDTVVVSGSDSITLGFNSNAFTSSIKRIENADGSITLKWKKIPGVEGYKIYQYQNVKNEYGYTTSVEVPSPSGSALPATATSHTFYPVTDTVNWTNRYVLYAYCGNDYVSYEVSPSVVELEKVSAITATANPAINGITVSWAPVAGASYYKVYRMRSISTYYADMDSYGNGRYMYDDDDAVQVQKTTGTLSADGTYYEAEPEFTTEIAGTSVVDMYLGYAEKVGDTVKVVDVQYGPEQGIRYYYYVQAFGSNGQPIGTAEYKEYRSSRYSKPASAILNNVTTTKPVIKKVAAAGKGKVNVTWKKSAGADKYIVYYSTKKKSGYTYGGITTGNKLTVKNLTPGKTYYFQVKGVKANAAGGDVYSSLSKAKSVKVK